ncbi:hypothetical protein BmR1_04g08265 [Babesia microti strain RI]|uniref:Uncharacterized protein n=1 Tax=Babesia microti (strain RI) TaxID=1133968 RepID=I7IHH8_BABMR|nr:hypothetical protein BmR1_04g08265 [Babesia microti strain RI]CCF75837.1 hypothetical protein BmR1_04g08265 [Babesia microti strain RI]|eukprot:XP_012650245.1 hypothetical protein BmR1_04g08265 [Babesia microti strain RI]
MDNYNKGSNEKIQKYPKNKEIYMRVKMPTYKVVMGVASPWLVTLKVTECGPYRTKPFRSSNSPVPCTFRFGWVHSNL